MPVRWMPVVAVLGLVSAVAAGGLPSDSITIVSPRDVTPPFDSGHWNERPHRGDELRQEWEQFQKDMRRWMTSHAHGLSPRGERATEISSEIPAAKPQPEKPLSADDLLDGVRVRSVWAFNNVQAAEFEWYSDDGQHMVRIVRLGDQLPGGWALGVVDVAHQAVALVSPDGARRIWRHAR